MGAEGGEAVSTSAQAAAYDAARTPGLALFLFEEVNAQTGELRPIDFGERLLGHVPHGWNMLDRDFASSDTPPDVTVELVPNGQLVADDLPWIAAVSVQDGSAPYGTVYRGAATIEGDVWRFESGEAVARYRPQVASGPERGAITPAIEQQADATGTNMGSRTGGTAGFPGAMRTEAPVAIGGLGLVYQEG